MLLDTPTAALALGVTPRTIRRWVRAGHLPNRGTPTRIRVALVDLAPMSARVCSTRELTAE